VKSLEQQGVLALHSVRSLLVEQETMLANAMRGLAAEFGLVVPKGMDKLERLVALVEEDEGIPERARKACVEPARAPPLHGGADRGPGAADRRARSARRHGSAPGHDPRHRADHRLADRGHGRGRIGDFPSARHFAAWLGLVPRQHSSGGKTRLGRITKAGNREIRTLLVLGATSMVYRAGRWNSAAGAWVRGLLERRPVGR
jgi:error-prone DNA polymerase